MKPYNNIGSQVKSKLEGYNDSPDTAVWTRIEEKLKKKRRRVLFWYFSSGIATVLLFVVTFYSFNYNSENNFKSNHQNIPIVKTSLKEENLRNFKLKDSYNKNYHSIINDTLNYSKNIKQHKVTKTKRQFSGYMTKVNKQIKSLRTVAINKQNRQQENSKNSNHTLKQNASKSNIAVNEINIISKSRNTKIYNSLKTRLETLKNKDSIETNLDAIIDSVNIADIKKVIPKEKEKTIKDSLNEKEIRWSINPQFIISKYGAFKAKTSNDITTNYGILVGYKLSEKAFLRFGIRKLDLTNNIDKIKYNIQYLEFPFELKYSIWTKKINPFITTGISYFKLQNNNSENENNLKYRKTAVSFNFGLGIEYELIDKLYLNIEPKFNYQIKPIITTTHFNPYIFSISTGIDYRF